MKTPRTFHEWLAKQEGREDEIGDLAEDTSRDKDWRMAEGESFYGLELGLEHHGEHVVDALRVAWAEWAAEEVVLAPSRRGFVYFIRSVDNDRIKIGWARNPRKRLSELQTGCSERLELLLAIPGTVADEHELHHIHRERRTHGEWFEDNDGLLSIHMRTCARALSLNVANCETDRAERLGDLMGRLREVASATIAMTGRGSRMAYASMAKLMEVATDACDVLIEEGACEGDRGTVH